MSIAFTRLQPGQLGLAFILPFLLYSHPSTADQEIDNLSPAQALVQMFMENWRFQSGDTNGNDCSDNWSPAVTNDMRYLVPWFPENKAAYWTFSYDRQQLDTEVMLRVEGEFPHARYASFTLYDGKTGRLISGKPSLKDVELEPKPGSENPFRAGVSRDVVERKYEMTVVPGSVNAVAHRNSLTIPDEVRYPMVVLRIYRADEGRSIEGGVGLPRVFLHEAESGSPVTVCPHPVLPLTEGLKASKRPDTRRYHASRIHFYAKHPEYSGLFGNPHNYYGQTGLNRKYGEVAVMRFKAASTPDTAGGGGVTSHAADLRYWSMCMGGDVFTNTSNCVWDDVATVDNEGYVKIAIGPATDEFKNAAAKLGYNPMPWGYHLRHVLYHRHMQGESNFSSSYKQVPHIDFSKPLTEQQADKFIGDYAPTGFYCETSAFISGDCGIE